MSCFYSCAYVAASKRNHERHIASAHCLYSKSRDECHLKAGAGEKRPTRDSLSRHNSWSHTVIGLLHSTSSRVDSPAAARRPSSHFFDTQINNTFHAFWCQWHAALLPMWLKKKRPAFQNFHVWCLWSSCWDLRMIFTSWLNSFSSCFHHEPWKHSVLSAVTLLTFFIWKTVICQRIYCQFHPIRCDYWFCSASLRASWSGGQWEVTPPEKLPSS